MPWARNLGRIALCLGAGAASTIALPWIQAATCGEPPILSKPQLTSASSTWAIPMPQTAVLTGSATAATWGCTATRQEGQDTVEFAKPDGWCATPGPHLGYSVETVAYGWPMRALRRVDGLGDGLLYRWDDGQAWRDATAWSRRAPACLTGGRGYVQLPLDPLWTGCAVDTASHAMVIGLALFGVTGLRRCQRRRRGLCQRCAYPIGVSPVCTECGSPVPPARPAVTPP